MYPNYINMLAYVGPKQGYCKLVNKRVWFFFMGEPWKNVVILLLSVAHCRCVGTCTLATAGFQTCMDQPLAFLTGDRPQPPNRLTIINYLTCVGLAWCYKVQFILISTPELINTHIHFLLAILLWVGPSLLINMAVHFLLNSTLLENHNFWIQNQWIQRISHTKCQCIPWKNQWIQSISHTKSHESHSKSHESLFWVLLLILWG